MDSSKFNFSKATINCTNSSINGSHYLFYNVDNGSHYLFYYVDNGVTVFSYQTKPKEEIILNGKVISKDEFLDKLKSIK